MFALSWQKDHIMRLCLFTYSMTYKTWEKFIRGRHI